MIYIYTPEDIEHNRVVALRTTNEDVPLNHDGNWFSEDGSCGCFLARIIVALGAEGRGGIREIYYRRVPADPKSVQGYMIEVFGNSEQTMDRRVLLELGAALNADMVELSGLLKDNDLGMPRHNLITGLEESFRDL